MAGRREQLKPKPRWRRPERAYRCRLQAQVKGWRRTQRIGVTERNKAAVSAKSRQQLMTELPANTR
jgi:hypothetical protein